VIAGGLFELSIVLPFVLGTLLMAVSVILEHKNYMRARVQADPAA
jgi:hypothetical protein